MSNAAVEQTGEPVSTELGSFPYEPSWFDKLEARIDKLPGHYLVYYSIFGLVIGLLSVLGIGSDSEIGGQFSPTTRLFGGFLIAYMLGMTHHLDGVATTAIEKIKPRLDLDEHTLAEAKFRLTNLPARKAVWVSLGALLILMLSVLFYPDLIGVEFDPSDPAYMVFLLQGIIVWWLLGLGAYHTIHQLREVSRTHEQYLRVNLYNPGELYALSSMSVISSFGVVAPVTLAIIVMPEYVVQPMGLAFLVVSTLVAGITLFWPLWNVHHAMVMEKTRLQAECSERYEALLTEWHAKIDERQLEGNADLYAAIQGLSNEKAEIEKIPTWPWSRGILRGWTASLFLPVAVWMIQFLLENFVFSR